VDSKQAFVQWVKRNDPFLYNVAAKRAAIVNGDGLGGLLDMFTSLSETVTKIAPQVLQIDAQRRILKTQLARAKQGLPPLETAEYAPTVKVSAAVTPEMEQAATRVAIQSTQAGLTQLQPFILGGMGLLAVYLFMRAKR
jgi:hypothetical protein